MTHDRLDESLSIIRWMPNTLARCFGCDVLLVDAWLSGEIEIPAKAGAWVEVLAQAHQAAETVKPKGHIGKKFDA
ncbi:hypothetical protein N7E70_021755 [Aminobacter sp. NyZ550]|uniref:hypothetical protein n=1 Tax=Aminobacter sp. NyZ550 TaxID=2979870 RepID=UPI0021D5B357|nr:hypothetical protein [Aminobacter sp. NyZ550]WAX94273.1 hypothetical protein N7E70_021755 [Aminobacter sp. NyZ550]